MLSIELIEDNEQQKLIEEYEGIKSDINIYSLELVELEKMISDFGVEHNNKLGETIREILKLRKEKFENDFSKKGRKNYKSASSDYEEFNQQYQTFKSENFIQLTAEQKLELKKLYRKASKLCHPDIVPEIFKEKAEIIFIQLKNAYERNDIDSILEILKLLESKDGFFSKNDLIIETSQIKIDILNSKNKLNEIKIKIVEIKKSESYQKIIKIQDWEVYFKTTKSILTEELNNLKNHD